MLKDYNCLLLPVNNMCMIRIIKKMIIINTKHYCKDTNALIVKYSKNSKLEIDFKKILIIINI